MSKPLNASTEYLVQKTILAGDARHCTESPVGQMEEQPRCCYELLVELSTPLHSGGGRHPLCNGSQPDTSTSTYWGFEGKPGQRTWDLALCSWGTKQKFVWCPKCWKPPQIDRERSNIPQQDGSQWWWDKVGVLEMIFEKRHQVLQQTDNIYQRGWEEFLLKQQCLGGTTRFLALPPSTIPWAVASFPFQFPGLVVP